MLICQPTALFSAGPVKAPSKTKVSGYPVRQSLFQTACTLGKYFRELVHPARCLDQYCTKETGEIIFNIIFYFTQYIQNMIPSRCTIKNYYWDILHILTLNL